MKVDDFTLIKADPELVSLLDNMKEILNNSKYQVSIITSIPAWVGEEGEEVIYSSGGVKRRYTYIDGAWNYVAYT